MTLLRDQIAPDPGQLERLAIRADDVVRKHPDYGRRMRQLERKLLEIDGHAVVWKPEKDVRILVHHGHEFPRDIPIELIKGERSACHWNIADIFDNPDAYGVGSDFAIVVGYVLDEDSPVWRQHTWGLSSDGRLIETTHPRAVYWGAELPHDYAQAWIADLPER